MSLNDTPSGERIHIGFFGRRNAGKSSLVNKVTNQDLAVVSDTKGTTTDPVTKAMELKMNYTELSPSQQNMYNQMRKAYRKPARTVRPDRSVDETA